MTLELKTPFLVDRWWGFHAGEAAGLPAPPPWAGQRSGLDWRFPPPGWPLRVGDWGGRPGGLSFTWGPCPRWLWGLRRWRLSFLRVLYLLRTQWLRLLQREHWGVQAFSEAAGETNAAVQRQAATSGRTLREAGTAWQLPQEPPRAAGGHPRGIDHAASVSAAAAHDGGGCCARHGHPIPWTFQVLASRIIDLFHKVLSDRWKDTVLNLKLI